MIDALNLNLLAGPRRVSGFTLARFLNLLSQSFGNHLEIRISSSSFFPLGQLHWQFFLPFLCCPQTPLKMIRNALRQSARTVGAVSVPSRLALVSYKTTFTLPLATRRYVIPPLEVPAASHEAIQLLQLLDGRLWWQKANHPIVHRTDAQLQQHSMQRQNRPELMLRRQKPRRQRSLRSWSRESEVFRRKPVSPRPVVSCPLGA